MSIKKDNDSMTITSASLMLTDMDALIKFGNALIELDNKTELTVQTSRSYSLAFRTVLTTKATKATKAKPATKTKPAKPATPAQPASLRPGGQSEIAKMFNALNKLKEDKNQLDAVRKTIKAMQDALAYATGKSSNKAGKWFDNYKLSASTNNNNGIYKIVSTKHNEDDASEPVMIPFKDWDDSFDKTFNKWDVERQTAFTKHVNELNSKNENLVNIYN